MLRRNDTRTPHPGLLILGVFFLIFAVNFRIVFALLFFCAVAGSSVFLKRWLRRFFHHPNNL